MTNDTFTIHHCFRFGITTGIVGKGSTLFGLVWQILDVCNLHSLSVILFKQYSITIPFPSKVLVIMESLLLSKN
jgi:hypothetical protein